MTERPAFLVLAGGGARGAFQAGAERILREEGGYRWTRVFGVSVGALNGTLIAQRRYDRLQELWRTVREGDVYRRFSWPVVAWRIAVRRKLGFYDNSPLRELIIREGSGHPFLVPAHAGRVSLVSGTYSLADSSDPEFLEAVWHSATLPAIWEPVGPPAWVDGGLRNIAPLGDAVDLDPPEVVAVLTAPAEIEPADRPGSIVDVVRRAVAEIAINEIVLNDVSTFVRINQLVLQAEQQGAILRGPDGKPYRYIPITVVLPQEPLGGVLDFSPDVLAARVRAGEAAARDALREQDEQRLLARLSHRGPRGA